MVNISRLNIIALNQSCPVYTISLLGITLEHKSELYVTKFHLQAR